MGTNQDPDAPRVVDVDLIHQLGEALRREPAATASDAAKTSDALAMYEQWCDDLTGAGEPVSMRLTSMHDVLPSALLDTTEPCEPWSPSNRDRALGHAVELGIVGMIDQANVVEEAKTFLAFLEGEDDVTPPTPFTTANLWDRMDELAALGLYVWGSDCIGECSGNTTPDSLVCDSCGGTRTTPLFGLSEDR